MKHLFSSGEILYSKNEKKLDQGTFTAETLKYSEVLEQTVYEAEGSIEGKQAIVRFKIKESRCGELKFKAMIKILMQSDLMGAEWECCEIEYL